MNSSSHSTATRNRKPAPCRLYSQGYCRFGDKCNFSHDSEAGVQPSGRDTHSDFVPSDPPSSSLSCDTSGTRPRPKRGETPCRAWQAGTCTRGAKCWFNHDIDKPGLESPELPKRKVSAVSCPVSFLVEESSPAVEYNPLREATVRERTNKEAAKTIGQVIFGSIVTYSAGLDVSHLLTGFETCTLRIENLPLDATEDDVQTLLKRQSLNVDHLHIEIKKKPNRRPEAHIVANVATGRAVASALDGIEFEEETLVVEMSATNSLEGMSAGGESPEVLTISWRAPSARYIAEYRDVATANAKVEGLDGFVYGSRRIKAEMNTQPRGRLVPNVRLQIKINNLPPSVTDQDVIRLTGSISVKRLRIAGLVTLPTVEQIARLIRDDIRWNVPGGLKKFDDPPSTCTMGGVVSARAHFSTWEEAYAAQTHLSGKRYGNQPVWLRLPDPMYFTLVIPSGQYKAQQAQWGSLLDSIKDRKACTLNVRDSGSTVQIRLSGSVKEATGALKVRVENLARGDKVEGWHRSLGIAGNPFVSRVRSETGAYLRVDWKRQSLKVYGAPRAVDEARGMIKNELDRLSSLDYTVTLPRNSVGFFIREGIQQLKETLGEENVRFAISSRQITISGGEEARHALDRLITLSHQGSSELSGASRATQTCPICYDNVSSPHQLGCGHTYCVTCLRHFISSALDSDQLPLTCLGDEARCRVPISIPTIQQFLPPASFNRLLEAAFDAYIAKHPDELKHCKTPDCTRIYRTVRAGASPQTLHCPSCFSAVCNGCHEDAHDGLSCAESRVRRNPAEQERLNDVWIASQNGRVKKCPQCSVPIEKLEGCNHMTCRCGAHICWRCMGIFTQQTIYDHMRSAHGGIHDDTPAAPEPAPFIGFAVDIEEQRELLRQVEVRRTAALRHQDYFLGAEQGWGWEGVLAEQQERMERLRLQRQREVEERERRLREQRLLREAEQRRREQERQQDGGWSCTIM